jgi:uncharacterized protein (TIGR02147 family)
MRQYFAERKAANPAFSHRLFARLAGFKTSNFMCLVMAGKRNLTKESTDKVALAMRLKKRERDYFELLVLFCQARTLREKESCLARLTAIRKSAFYQPIGDDRSEYISHWLHPVVRELVGIMDGSDCERELAGRIAYPVTPAKVRESIELLVRLGLLRQVSGKLAIAHSLLSTGPGVAAASAVRYHIGAMTLAAEALNRFGAAEREIVGMTIGISRATFNRIRERIWDLRQEILASADDPKPEQVYQLNIQLFPMTKGKA